MKALLELQSKCFEVIAEWDNLEWTVQANYKDRWYQETNPVLAKAAKEVLTQIARHSTGTPDTTKPGA